MRFYARLLALTSLTFRLGLIGVLQAWAQSVAAAKKTSTLLTLLFALATLTGASTARAQTLLWENRGQPEFMGSATDIDGAGNTVVVTGWVINESFSSQWFVRALDRRTGATVWEDRFGPVGFAESKDVAIERDRAFVAGYMRTPGLGYEFVVRAYDLTSGGVLWSQQVNRGPQCLEEAPGFARCVAKALVVHGGRVFVVGHLTRTAAQSDFAVLAFDAAAGTPLWESVTDSTGTGAYDYAWAVSAVGDNVFVLGEVGDDSGLLLQSHDARTGAIGWRQQVPGASIFTDKDALAADRDGVLIAGMNAQLQYFVQAYDAKTGSLRWQDVDVEGLGWVTDLTLGQSEEDRRNGQERRQDRKDSQQRVFATGVVGCNLEFLECELAVKAYDPRRGLVWQKRDQARGGDWYASGVSAGGGRLFVGAQELLEDGVYHPTIRSYVAEDGDFEWATFFDDGGYEPFGFTGVVPALSVLGGRLLASGSVYRSDGGGDLLVRMYRRR